MNVEDRLRDALHEYRAQVRPSPALLDRIENAAPRRRDSRRRWVAVAAVAVAVALVFTVVLVDRADDRSTEIASGPRTRADVIAGADRACTDIRVALRETQVVFPTAAAYGVVATQRLAIARTTLARTEALPELPSLSSSVAAAADELRAAVDAAQRAQGRAAAGAVTDAAAALQEFNAALARAGQHFADIGAAGCAIKEGSQP